MSLSLFSTALNDFDGTPTERLVMLALADLSDDAGSVLVVPQEIGFKARIPLSEALEVLRDFVRRGVLQEQPKLRRIYRINLALLHQKGGSR